MLAAPFWNTVAVIVAVPLAIASVVAWVAYR